MKPYVGRMSRQVALQAAPALSLSCGSAAARRPSYSTHGTSRRQPCQTLSATGPLSDIRPVAVEHEQMERSKAEQHRSTGRAPSGHTGWLDGLRAKLLYSYFNWRRDNFSDLQLIFALNVVVILLAGLVRHAVLNGNNTGVWQDIYAVSLATFGEAWPDTAASVPEQAFSLLAYVVGLSGFALVVALVEQSVLQVLDERVRQGSKVLEKNHYVVLLWGTSQADIKKLEIVLQQLCAAHRADGGTTIAVLCQREKLEMEAQFAARLPEADCYGSRFVFRQGMPLLVSDLELVSAGDARCVLLLSDASRCPDEADSQVVRVLVLLDEMEEALRAQGAPRPKLGHVVAEIQDFEAVTLLGFTSTHKPVIPMPTLGATVGRIAAMLRRPSSAEIGDMLWDFTSDASIYLHKFPGLVGKTIADVSLSFPDAIVIGFVERPTGYALINPPANYRLSEDEDLLVLRPTGISQASYTHLPQPVAADIGDWVPGPDPGRLTLPSMAVPTADAAAREVPSSLQEALTGADGDAVTSFELQDLILGSSVSASASVSCSLFSLAKEWVPMGTSPVRLLVAGWGEQLAMQLLLRALDAVDEFDLPKGSSVVFVNNHDRESTLDAALEGMHLANINVAHHKADPLKRSKLAAVDVSSFDCAVVLCDEKWKDPDEDASNGTAIGMERDVLRLDAMLLRVQLNLRSLMAEHTAAAGHAAGQGSSSDGSSSSSSSSSSGNGNSSYVGTSGGNGVSGVPSSASPSSTTSNGSEAARPPRSAHLTLVCEKLGTESHTKFEDRSRLPFGMTINFSTYAARLMAQLAYSPRMVLPRSINGLQVEPRIVDAELYAQEGEAVSFWQLIRRAQLRQHLLLGYYLLPVRASDSIQAFICPKNRAEQRIWNVGPSGRLKFLILTDVTTSSRDLRPGALWSNVTGHNSSAVATAGL